MVILSPAWKCSADGANGLLAAQFFCMEMGLSDSLEKFRARQIDPIEMEAVSAVYGQPTAEARPCVVGG